jgi:hypothetical protein
VVVCPRCGEESPDRARFCLACALDLYRSAAERWASFGHVYEQAQALLGAGRCAQMLGEEPGSGLALAGDLFSSLGAAPHLAAVRRLTGEGVADATGS